MEHEEDIACIPQEIAVCACTGWPTGVATCTDDSEWGECVCEIREYCEHLGEQRFEFDNEHKPGPHVITEMVDRSMGGQGGACVGFQCLGGGARW